MEFLVAMTTGHALFRRVANQEAENSDDLEYVNRILNANESMKLVLPVMIHKAKLLATQPDALDNYSEWANANKNVSIRGQLEMTCSIEGFFKRIEPFQLLAAITNVRLAVSANDVEESMFTPSPRSSNGQEFFGERSQVDFGGYYDQNSALRFQYQKPNYPSKPTPLPDLIEENETELPDPRADEPILVSSNQTLSRVSFISRRLSV